MKIRISGRTEDSVHWECISVPSENKFYYILKFCTSMSLHIVGSEFSGKIYSQCLLFQCLHTVALSRLTYKETHTIKIIFAWLHHWNPKTIFINCDSAKRIKIITSYTDIVDHEQFHNPSPLTQHNSLWDIKRYFVFSKTF